jgi:hypothetical protein
MQGVHPAFKGGHLVKIISSIMLTLAYKADKMFECA